MFLNITLNIIDYRLRRTGNYNAGLLGRDLGFYPTKAKDFFLLEVSQTSLLVPWNYSTAKKYII